MIIPFPIDRQRSILHDLPEAGDGILDVLAEHWTRQRGEAELPDPDELFLGDLMTLMPHILLAYRSRRVYRVEYAGAVARALLPRDPTGAEIDPLSPCSPLAEIAAHILAAHHRGAPVLARHDGLVALHLPFGRADHGVTLVMTALCPAPGRNAGDIVSLPNADTPTDRDHFALEAERL